MSRWIHLTVKFLMILMFLGLASACAASPGQSTTQQEGFIEVDSTFREFYQNLGGQEILGPAISPVFPHENIICQYTESSLMCFNTLGNDPNRLYLYELATTFEIENFGEQVISDNTQERIVNDIPIYEEFQPVYDRLYGARYVGKPLTPVRYNPYKQRFEQYFENLGFYRLVDAPRGDVHLLSYGAYVCDIHCRSNNRAENAIIDLPENVNIPFLPYIIRMGSPLAFGEPISHPLPFQNNEILQVYDSVVFVGNPDIPTSIRLLNLPELLGMPRHVPGPQLYTENDGVIFYAVDGNNGFHIPLDFDRFISRNGSYELSGQPISAVFPLEEGKIYQQCFQNYCLVYDATQDPGEKVSMASLGNAYSKYAGLNEDQVVQFLYSPETVLFNISEIQPQIPADQPQQIDLAVLMRRNNLPLENIEAFLYLTLPNGETLQYSFPPTDADGISHFTIPAQPQLSNGDLIGYEVCLNLPTDQPLCHQDNYLIWAHK